MRPPRSPRLAIRIPGAALLFLAGCSAPKPADPPAIVGTRQLAEYANWDSAGALVQEFGPHPVGYIIFDGTSHFSVHIMRTPPARPFAAGPDKPTPTESREFLRTYYGAFGGYRVDSTQSMIAFQVEGGTRPDFIGTEVRLPYHLTGDSLILGDQKTWRRVWLRVR